VANRELPEENAVAPPNRSPRLTRVIAMALAACAGVYVTIAYGLLPAYWRSYSGRHPLLTKIPKVTTTVAGLPGDPLNVTLIGSEDDVLRIMKEARWALAVRLGVRADLRLATDAVISRSDPDAPVSTQYLFGRPEDLAFEQQVGDNPRHRHHVRFWRAGEAMTDGRPQWIGAAVYDRGLGFSHLTGQVTHATTAAVDDERNFLFQSLERTGDLLDRQAVAGYHAVREGRNGDGNPWHTDGRMFVGTISRAAGEPSSQGPS